MESLQNAVIVSMGLWRSQDEPEVIEMAGPRDVSHSRRSQNVTSEDDVLGSYKTHARPASQPATETSVWRNKDHCGLTLDV